MFSSLKKCHREEVSVIYVVQKNGAIGTIFIFYQFPLLKFLCIYTCGVKSITFDVYALKGCSRAA